MNGGVDFVLENVNRKIKSFMPFGVPLMKKGLPLAKKITN